MAAAGASVSFSSTKETTNYARLCRLLVDVGSCVLRDTFDRIYPPSSLHKDLMTHHTTLQLLQKKRVLNPTQWGKLYPAMRTSVSSRDFDITLLTVLLRNICWLSPPATGWDALPPDTDLSTGADIARVKYFRNTVYGHAEQASVDDATFNACWQDIQDTLVRLGGAKYIVAIDDMRDECMDPEFEEHYEELLRQWKKDDDNTKDKLDEIDRKLEELMKASTSTSKAKDVEEPSELIERIRQLYRTREGRLSPFPWCEQFNFSLNDIFTKPTIVTRDKTRRAAAEQITSITGVFKPHKECSKPRTVLIEGEPGIGKTTYCQKLAYDWANGQETDASFPKIKLLLLLKCHDISGNIWEAIDDQLLPKDIEDEAKEKFFKYIRANQSQVLLVLDGLDEAPSNLTKMFSDLVESRELPKCNIVLTSRHEGGIKLSKYCNSLLEIVGFTTESSRSFIDRYFKDMEALGQELLEEIEQSKELEELTANPLFVALLCLVCEDLKGSLPSSKTRLFLEITNFILKRFRRKQGLSDNSENLIEVYKEELERLGRIALKALERDEMYVEESRLEGTTSESPLFEFLAVQSECRKRRSHTCYRFSHKSFQEFFGGFYLSHQISGETDFERVLPRNYVKFAQVLLYTVGITGLRCEEDVLALLKTMIKKANFSSNRYVQSYYLCFSLECIGECTTENSRLRTQMIQLLGTNLDLQTLTILGRGCDIKMLAEALKYNATTTTLSFCAQLCGDVCAVSLAETLRVNNTLTEVIMMCNVISACGVQQLVDALMVNSTLRTLHLSFNELEDNGARILADYLKANKALTSLHVAANNIGNAGATSLAESLRMNTTLNVLELEKNPSIGNPGATSLCEALKVNKTLSSLNLSESGIGDTSVQSLSAVLKTNTSLTSLDLADVKISAHGVRSVAAVLRVNSTLNRLDFQGNKVGSGGARLIAESLKANTALKHLNLSRNNIKAPCARLFCEALQVNRTLTSLSLAENDLGARGALLLSDGLRVNTSLTNLDLSGNAIGAEGAESIVETLKLNTTLTSLKLAKNGIGDSGAKSLSEALKANVSLYNLNLSNNSVGAAGADSIAEALKRNAALTCLNLSINVIGDFGAQSLSEALKANATLTVLNVSCNRIQSTGALAFTELRKHNSTLKTLDLRMNNVGNLGDVGDQELCEVPFLNWPIPPFLSEITMQFTEESYGILVSKETILLPWQ